MPRIEPHRDESSSAAPWISPGLVADNETVLRTIFDPQHIQNGELQNAAISLEDIRSRGWSVERKRFTSLWRIKLTHYRWRLKKSDLKRCYVIPIDVGALRTQCQFDQNHKFIVIDDALYANPAHAAVLISKKCGEGMARKARGELMKFMPPHIKLSRAFSTRDRWGWTRALVASFLTFTSTLLKKARSLIG
jgi:hypothetical protein